MNGFVLVKSLRRLLVRFANSAKTSADITGMSGSLSASESWSSGTGRREGPLSLEESTNPCVGPSSSLVCSSGGIDPSADELAGVARGAVASPVR